MRFKEADRVTWEKTIYIYIYIYINKTVAIFGKQPLTYLLKTFAKGKSLQQRNTTVGEIACIIQIVDKE